MANLIDTAIQAEKFSTLVEAIKATELVEILQGEGPMTVLAPTNEAFDQLPKGMLNQLLLDLPMLRRVLMYHVLFADARQEDLMEIDEAPTAEGSVVAVEHSGNHVRINDAAVVETDILTDNGVIHAIDTVLMPSIIESELRRNLLNRIQR